MPDTGAFGDHLAACFGLTTARSLTTTPLKASQLAITRLSCTAGRDGLNVRIPPDDAFLVMLYLEDVWHSDVTEDRPPVPARNYPRRSICLVNLQDGAAVLLQSRLESLAFYIPRSLVDELTDDAGEPRIVAFPCEHRGEMDPVISHLGAALLPFFDETSGVHEPLLQHIALAFVAHLVHRYSAFPLRAAAEKSSLTRSQEKRAKAFMIENFASNISVADIAASVGLSSRQFSEGFKAGTGVTPHQWLLKLRIDRAKHLLSSTHIAIAEVAAACGFADHSHLTRAFQRYVAATPTVWRSKNLH